MDFIGFFFVISNSLMLDESLHQLWPQPTESVRKTFWKSSGGFIILWPAFFLTALLLLLLFFFFTASTALFFFSGCLLSLCLLFWTKVGISWEGPEHVEYIEPPVSPQQPLSIH